MLEPSPLTGRRVAALATVGALLHGAFDFLTYRIAVAKPPYLRMEDAPEVFRMLSPAAVSIAVCCISGIIGVIAVLATPPWHRRPLVVGGIVTAFWLFSALLMSALWLSTPWTTTLVAALCGVPRGLVVGWFLALLSTARLSTSTGGEA